MVLSPPKCLFSFQQNASNYLCKLVHSCYFYFCPACHIVAIVRGMNIQFISCLIYYVY